MKKDNIGRRDFLIKGGIGAAAIALSSNLSKQAFAAEPSEPPTLPASISQRQIIPLNHKWLYSGKPAAANVSEISMSSVTIPHTNKMLPWHGFDDKEYEFISSYKRHFRLPADLRGKRIFVDFGGVMTAAKVSINGKMLGEYKGGYNPFSFELTNDINWKGDNLLAVEVDSTERKDIPPFGNLVDYLTFGGIYRDVAIRAVPEVFIENVFAKPVNVLRNDRSLNIKLQLNLGNGVVEGASTPELDRAMKALFLPADLSVETELRDGNKVIASKTVENISGTLDSGIVLTDLDNTELWDTQNPKLYNVQVRLLQNKKVLDHYETRIGFREAKFTPEGFYLNGKHLKLRGLNRHQTFPYVGQAAPARVQKRDAWILRKELHCNIVRTSHYPQSTHFLDACDEYGLLVLEEIPGWQHIGDKDWQDLVVHNVDKMITRDWNHPSIILWGVRVNESGDNHDLYTKTNALAHSLDDSRQTGGIRYRYGSERLEDVFTMNDFGFPLRPPNHPLYLNTEFSGHMYPTKRGDNVERVREHTHRHARVHDQLASDDKYAGGLGWCAFDYNTHDYFGSGDRICYHGVSDIFRIPKPAAGFYMSQCEPSEQVVLEPAFDWARGDENETFSNALVCSNCEKLKYYIGDRLIGEVGPDRKTYPSLKYAPFSISLHDGIGKGWEDLRIEGYIDGKKVIERKMSARGVDREFHAAADDKELYADGIDMTRVVFKVTDEFGNIRPFANAGISLSAEGPGEIVGENPFALFGGVGAVWIKTKQATGVIRLNAKHPWLGTKTIEIKAAAPPAGSVESI
jgi:beta-galactosidase